MWMVGGWLVGGEFGGLRDVLLACDRGNIWAGGRLTEVVRWSEVIRQMVELGGGQNGG